MACNIKEPSNAMLTSGHRITLYLLPSSVISYEKYNTSVTYFMCVKILSFLRCVSFLFKGNLTAAQIVVCGAEGEKS